LIKVTEDNDELDDELKARWESILSAADISSIPVNFLKAVEISLLNGTIENFDIFELKNKGLSIDEIEKLLDDFMEQNDEDIDSLDFHLNIEALANDVNEKTKRLLG